MRWKIDMYSTQLNNWGNSQAIRIPKHILDNAGLNTNDEVEIEVLDDSIVIKKKRPYSIKELLRDEINSDYKYEEWDTGIPVAEEQF